MAMKPFADGDVLYAGDVLEWLQPKAAYKSGSTSRSNTTSATADPDLQVTLAANAVYRLLGQVLYDGDPSVDFKFGFTIPGSGTVNYTVSELTTGAAAATDDQVIPRTATVTGLGCLGVGTTAGAMFTGLVRTGSPGGTMSLDWGPMASSATATRLFADSFIELQRVG